MTRTGRTWCAVACMATALGGCASERSPAPSAAQSAQAGRPAASLDLADFAQQADAICVETNRALYALARRPAPHARKLELAAALERAGQRRLEALVPPPALRADHRRLRRALARRTLLTERRARELDAGTLGASTLRAINAQTDLAHRLAARLHLRVCPSY